MKRLHTIICVTSIALAAFSKTSIADDSSGSTNAKTRTGIRGTPTAENTFKGEKFNGPGPNINWDYFNETGYFHLAKNSTNAFGMIAVNEGGWQAVFYTMQYESRLLLSNGDEGYVYKLTNDPSVRFLFVYNRAALPATDYQPARYWIYKSAGYDPPQFYQWNLISGISYP